MVLGNQSTSTSGAVLLTPNPYMTAIETSRFYTTFPIIGVTSMNNYSGFSDEVWYSTPDLTPIMSTARVVGFGITVRCLTPLLSRTGRIIIAPIGTMSSGMDIVALSNVTLANAYAQRLTSGISTNTLATASLLNLPGAMQMSLCDMSNCDLVCASKPNSADAFKFRTTYQSDYITSATRVDTVVSENSNTYAPNQSGVSDYFELGVGMTSFAIYYDGAPANTPVLEIDYVYHFEGTPVVNVNAETPVPSHQPAAKETGTLDGVLNAIRTVPWAKIVNVATDIMGTTSGRAEGFRMLR
jgi:hypothetical protein